jgi:hypothetical protein
MSTETLVLKTKERTLGPIYAQITPETYSDSSVVALLVEAKGYDGIRHSERQVLDEDWLYSNFEFMWERMGALLKKHMQQYYAQAALEQEQKASFE